MHARMKRPSPAFVVAMIAMFLALGGTAGAVVTAAVPLAKRALVADNAKKVGGVTAAQLGGAAVQLALKESPAGPRPASTAAGLMTTKSVAFSVGAEAEQVVTATCDAGSKAVGGGFNNPTSALVLSAGSFATSDGTGWTEDLLNVSSSAAAGTVVVMCLK
jgi:hypothetical protein